MRIVLVVVLVLVLELALISVFIPSGARQRMLNSFSFSSSGAPGLPVDLPLSPGSIVVLVVVIGRRDRHTRDRSNPAVVIPPTPSFRPPSAGRQTRVRLRTTGRRGVPRLRRAVFAPGVVLGDDVGGGVVSWDQWVSLDLWGLIGPTGLIGPMALS